MRLIIEMRPIIENLRYLEHSNIPMALGRVAKETVEEMVETLTSDGSERVESEQEAEEKIAGIDLSQSCLSEDEKTQFR